MTTRAITGTVKKPDGTVYTDAAVVFKLKDDIISSGVVVPKHDVDITTSALGAFSVTLFVPDSGTCTYEVILPDGYSQEVELASGAATDLQTILTVPTSEATPSALQVIIDAHVAASDPHPDKFTLTNTETAVGINALASNTGLYNTAIGVGALGSNVAGTGNTAVGWNTLPLNTSGINNIAIGPDTLYHNTTGNYNVAVGAQALVTQTTGEENTAIGDAALRENTTGGFNTAVGSTAMRANTIGTSNAAVGVMALGSNTEGNENTAVGRTALEANTTGDSNTAVGYLANALNLTGDSNVAVGVQALYKTTVSFNTAVGATAMINNTLGIRNIAVGFASLYTNTEGNDNISIGVSALRFNTTGINNTAIGYLSLYNNITGHDNVAIGYNAGYATPALTTNTYCVFIGDNTKTDADGRTNSVVIGSGAIGTKDNQVVLGNVSIAETILRGNLSIFGHAAAGQQLKASNNNWATLGDVVGALVALGLFDTE